VLAGLVVLGCAALIGCGERQFDEQELVEELNAAGAGLVLGEPLPSTSDDVTVTTVEFDEAHEEEEAGHSHGGGAVAIVENEEAAVAEFERCQSAIDFTCFRVGNAVLRFVGITPEEQTALTSAMRSLEG
jgi:hypothetical protein